MKYIRDYYGVPAKRGGRVRYTPYGNGDCREGVITGSFGAHIKVKMDGEKRSHPYHPTWQIEYL